MLEIAERAVRLHVVAQRRPAGDDRLGDYGADQVDFIPITRVSGGAALAQGEKATEILEGFERRSKRIRIEGFVPARYETYAVEQKDKLFHVFLSGNAMLKGLSVLTGRRPTRMYAKQSKTNILNTLRCESIRELMIRGLVREVSPSER